MSDHHHLHLQDYSDYDDFEDEGMLRPLPHSSNSSRTPSRFSSSKGSFLKDLSVDEEGSPSNALDGYSYEREESIDSSIRGRSSMASVTNSSAAASQSPIPRLSRRPRKAWLEDLSSTTSTRPAPALSSSRLMSSSPSSKASVVREVLELESVLTSFYDDGAGSPSGVLPTSASRSRSLGERLEMDEGEIPLIRRSGSGSPRIPNLQRQTAHTDELRNNHNLGKDPDDNPKEQSYHELNNQFNSEQPNHESHNQLIRSKSDSASTYYTANSASKDLRLSVRHSKSLSGNSGFGMDDSGGINCIDGMDGMDGMDSNGMNEAYLYLDEKKEENTPPSTIQRHFQVPVSSSAADTLLPPGSPRSAASSLTHHHDDHENQDDQDEQDDDFHKEPNRNNNNDIQQDIQQDTHLDDLLDDLLDDTEISSQNEDNHNGIAEDVIAMDSFSGVNEPNDDEHVKGIVSSYSSDTGYLTNDGIVTTNESQPLAQDDENCGKDERQQLHYTMDSVPSSSSPIPADQDTNRGPIPSQNISKSQNTNEYTSDKAVGEQECNTFPLPPNHNQNEATNADYEDDDIDKELLRSKLEGSYVKAIVKNVEVHGSPTTSKKKVDIKTVVATDVVQEGYVKIIKEDVETWATRSPQRDAYKVDVTVETEGLVKSVVNNVERQANTRTSVDVTITTSVPSKTVRDDPLVSAREIKNSSSRLENGSDWDSNTHASSLDDSNSNKIVLMNKELLNKLIVPPLNENEDSREAPITASMPLPVVHQTQVTTTNSVALRESTPKAKSNVNSSMHSDSSIKSDDANNFTSLAASLQAQKEGGLLKSNESADDEDDDVGHFAIVETKIRTKLNKSDHIMSSSRSETLADNVSEMTMMTPIVSRESILHRDSSLSTSPMPVPPTSMSTQQSQFQQYHIARQQANLQQQQDDVAHAMTPILAKDVSFGGEGDSVRSDAGYSMISTLSYPTNSGGSYMGLMGGPSTNNNITLNNYSDRPSPRASGTFSAFSSNSRITTGSSNSNTRKRISELIRKDLWSRDCSVVEEALCELADKAAVASQYRNAIARSGGILAIVRAMEQNDGIAAIQVAACQALEKLALETENELAIGEVGGVDAVLAAMMGHVGNSLVQEAAWSALWNLTCGNACDEMTTDTEGGMVAIVACMKQHATNPAVQRNACGALTNLCLQNSIRLRALAEADGFVAIATALQNHWDDDAVRKEASHALTALLEKPINDLSDDVEDITDNNTMNNTNCQQSSPSHRRTLNSSHNNNTTSNSKNLNKLVKKSFGSTCGTEYDDDYVSYDSL